MSLNQHVIVGRLGADPDPRQTSSGDTVVTLSICTDERAKDGDTWTTVPNWHRVVVFGKQADNVVKYKKKGEWLGIVGSVRTRKWQDNDGSDRWTTETKAHQVQFIGNKADGSGSSEPTPADDSDLPF